MLGSALGSRDTVSQVPALGSMVGGQSPMCVRHTKAALLAWVYAQVGPGLQIHTNYRSYPWLGCRYLPGRHSGTGLATLFAQRKTISVRIWRERFSSTSGEPLVILWYPGRISFCLSFQSHCPPSNACGAGINKSGRYRFKARLTTHPYQLNKELASARTG